MFTTVQKREKLVRLSLKAMGAALAVIWFAGSVLHAKNMRTMDATLQQDKITVQGKVLDRSTNEPIVGDSIRSNGRTLGSSDTEGAFRLQVPAGSVVSFSIVGYEMYEQTFNTNSDNARVLLNSSSEQISEVVVTALGIKREQKALGYSVTTVSGEQLTDAIS